MYSTPAKRPLHVVLMGTGKYGKGVRGNYESIWLRVIRQK